MLTQHEVNNDSEKAERKQPCTEEVTASLSNEVHRHSVISTNVLMSIGTERNSGKPIIIIIIIVTVQLLLKNNYIAIVLYYSVTVAIII